MSIATNIQVNAYDPTRTLTLREQWAREMRVRFERLNSVVMETIHDNDAFGLLATHMTAAERRQFDSPTSRGKVEAFMSWLAEQQQDGILEVRRMVRDGADIDQAWTDVYITDSYERGVQRARTELRQAGYNVPTIEETGGVRASMSGPIHADRLGVLYTRAFNELKGVTAAMDQQISRVLTDGIAQGKHPRRLAREMRRVITGRGEDLGITDKLGRYIPAKRRAEMIARTEIIRAHHKAQIMEYKNWEVEGVHVVAEWSTMGDFRVCDECEALERGGPYTLEEIEDMIPRHPICRCMARPVTREEAERRKKRRAA